MSVRTFIYQSTVLNGVCLSDMIFYVFALMLLLTFFYDERIEWHEAVAMLAIYVIYGIFMKYNSVLEMFVKYRVLHRSPLHATSSVCQANTLHIFHPSFLDLV